MKITSNINENTVNEKEIKTMEQNKMNNGATETQVTEKRDMLTESVFMELEAGKLYKGMTQDACIEQINMEIDGKTQVWAYADERVIAITSDSSKVPALTTKLKKIWSDVTCERVSGARPIQSRRHIGLVRFTW